MAQSISTAFSNVPASTEKTGLVNAFNSVITAIGAAKTAGAITDNVEAQLKDEVIDVAESVASNIQNWTGA